MRIRTAALFMFLAVAAMAAAAPARAGAPVSASAPAAAAEPTCFNVPWYPFVRVEYVYYSMDRIVPRYYPVTKRFCF